jgi:hypothetical protein
MISNLYLLGWLRILYKKAGNAFVAKASVHRRKPKEKIYMAERQLNNLAMEKMTIERLTERDGFEEIKGWLDTIKALWNKKAQSITKNSVKNKYF